MLENKSQIVELGREQREVAAKNLAGFCLPPPQEDYGYLGVDSFIPLSTISPFLLNSVADSWEKLGAVERQGTEIGMGG